MLYGNHDYSIRKILQMCGNRPQRYILLMFLDITIHLSIYSITELINNLSNY